MRWGNVEREGVVRQAWGVSKDRKCAAARNYRDIEMHEVVKVSVDQAFSAPTRHVQPCSRSDLATNGNCSVQ